MIKVVNLVSLMAAPVIVQYRGTTGSYMGAGLLIVLLIWAVGKNKQTKLAIARN